MKTTSKYCDIIIPVWNRPVETRSCLESIFSCTSFSYRLILVDNASNNETKELIDCFTRSHKDEIHLVRNDTNRGYIQAVNQGLTVSTAQYVCLLNSDTVVAPGWLSEMIRIANSEQCIGLVNPDSNNFGLKTKGKAPEEMAQLCQTNNSIMFEQSGCTGFCMLIKRAVLDRIGTFDEGFGMGFFEDSDFSFRARKAGFLCVRALHAYVHHKQHASFDLLGNWDNEFQQNKERFEKRWGTLQRIAVLLKKKRSNVIPEKLITFIRSYLDSGAGITLFCSRKQRDDLLNAWDNKGYLHHVNLTFSTLPSLFIPWKIFFKKKKFTDVALENASSSLISWITHKTGARVLKLEY